MQDPQYDIDRKRLGVSHLEHDARPAIAAYVGADVIGTSGVDNACLFQGLDAGLSQFEDPFSSQSFDPFSRDGYSDAWNLMQALCMDAISGDLATGLPRGEISKVWLSGFMHLAQCMLRTS